MFISRKGTRNLEAEIVKLTKVTHHFRVSLEESTRYEVQREPNLVDFLGTLAVNANAVIHELQQLVEAIDAVK